MVLVLGAAGSGSGAAGLALNAGQVGFPWLLRVAGHTDA